jgi:hypothetical protein
MFLITWMFDKLGYMPKIDMQIGKVNIEAAWPFPVGEEEPKAAVKKRKPVVKKATTVAKKAK